MNQLVKDIVYSSIINLFQNQPDIFENTSQTNFTEWNLSFHVSNEISKYIFWLNVDIDVTKRNYENKRPDIIFHRRKTNLLNFLVVELKKSQHDRQNDIRKIKEDWMRKPLNYRYGLYINIWGLDKYKAILFENGGTEFEVNESCNYIKIPKINHQVLIENKRYIDDIIFNNREMDIKRINGLIDCQILNTYEKDLIRVRT